MFPGFLVVWNSDKMKCRSCGNSITRSINRLCVDCYIGCNLPTEVNNTPWIRAFSFSRGTERRLREDKLDEKLASAITSMKAKISEDRTAIVLEVEERRISIPVTVEKLDELAQKSGILVGKWLIYRSNSEIDDVWKIIARATFDGGLGRSAKVSTAMQKNRRHVICVYTENYLDLENVMRVREKLRLLGFTDRLCYKPDIYTYLGIYYKTTPLSSCRYRK